MLKSEVYWQSTLADQPLSKPRPLPERVDVAVIGGGYTGLSAARTLAQRGANVAVLESETMGWGASSRNGGMVLTGLKISMQSAMKRYGTDVARRLFRFSLDGIDEVEQLVRQEGIACGFARSGHLLLANKPAQYAALAEEAEFMAAHFGHVLRLVPQASQRNEIGSDLYFGGLVDEVSAGLNPAQYVAGLARAAEKAGAHLCPQARVMRLERSGSGFTVETARGSLAAGQVLVATSGYTGKATPALRRKIIPIGSYIIATERLRDDVVRALNPHGRMIFDYKHYLHYYRIWDQRLIFGGRAAFFPENSSTILRSAEILRQDMLAVFPQLKEAPIEYAWGGTLDFAFDTMPHVGETDGMWYALGYAGHGVAMATHLGSTTAAAMLDGGIKGHPLHEIPFPGAPLGLYNGWPWFLPFVGVWYRILDLLE
jgi:glycine/D-amino acid oxidase-like deaminating enzyme